MICFALFNSTSLFAWTEPVNISNTSLTSNCPYIAIGKDNLIHVAWVDFSHDLPVRPEILYRHFDGDSWLDIINISNDQTDSWDPKIAVDTLGNPHIIWIDQGQGEGPPRLYYSFFDGDIWSSPVCLVDTFGIGFIGVAEIAIDSENVIHLLLSSYGKIYYTRYTENSWTTPVLITPVDYQSFGPVMALDPAGCLHVIYSCFTYEWEEDSVELFYTKCEDESWDIPTRVTYLVGKSYRSDISIDSYGSLYLVWEEGRYQDYQIYCSSFEGNSWMNPISLDSLVNETGYFPSIAVDHQGDIHVVWTSSPVGIYYAYYSKSSWVVYLLITGLTTFPHVIIDYSQYLHMVWVQVIDYVSNISDIFYSNKDLSGIEESNSYLIDKCTTFPNPFTTTTKIYFTLDKSCNVTITISNLAGEIIMKLDLGYMQAGSHAVTIFLDEQCVPSGVCFYQLNAGKNTATGKIVLVR